MHKVPGNFHLSSHDAPDVVMKLIQKGYKLDFTHKINHLSFGDQSETSLINEKYGGSITNELSKTEYKQNVPFG